MPERNDAEAEDVNNCVSYSGPYYVSNIGGADITAVQSVNPTCQDTNGQIIITATGGLGSLEYSIDGGQLFQPGNTFQDLQPGAYDIEVRDEHGCITAYGTQNLQNQGQAVVVTTGSNSPVCEGDKIELTSDLSGARI